MAVERKRQITQDLEATRGAPMYVQLNPDQSVVKLVTQRTMVDVRIPSRVEGRYRISQFPQVSLGRLALYPDIAHMIIADRVDRQNRGDSEWTLEDIPADVMQRCDEWVAECDEFAGRRTGALHDTAHSIATATDDRMQATTNCPKCLHAQPQYACRTSGWSKELYTYPLVKVRDEGSGEVYEVPLDVALYIDEHPDDSVIQVSKSVDRRGDLSAAYDLMLGRRRLTAAYVQRATNGRVRPMSSTVTIEPDTTAIESIRMRVGAWDESKGGSMAVSFTDHFTPELIIKKLQSAVTVAFAERVTDIDNNEIYRTLQEEIGLRGLKLFFRWVDDGPGETVPEYAIGNDAYEMQTRVRGMDAYNGLTKLAQQLDVLPADKQYRQ